MQLLIIEIYTRFQDNNLSYTAICIKKLTIMTISALQSLLKILYKAVASIKQDKRMDYVNSTTYGLLEEDLRREYQEEQKRKYQWQQQDYLEYKLKKQYEQLDRMLSDVLSQRDKYQNIKQSRAVQQNTQILKDINSNQQLLQQISDQFKFKSNKHKLAAISTQSIIQNLTKDLEQSQKKKLNQFYNILISYFRIKEIGVERGSQTDKKSKKYNDDGKLSLKLQFQDQVIKQLTASEVRLKNENENLKTDIDDLKQQKLKLQKQINQLMARLFKLVNTKVQLEDELQILKGQKILYPDRKQIDNQSQTKKITYQHQDIQTDYWEPKKIYVGKSNKIYENKLVQTQLSNTDTASMAVVQLNDQYTIVQKRMQFVKQINVVLKGIKKKEESKDIIKREQIEKGINVTKQQIVRPRMLSKKYVQPISERIKTEAVMPIHQSDKVRTNFKQLLPFKPRPTQQIPFHKPSQINTNIQDIHDPKAPLFKIVSYASPSKDNQRKYINQTICNQSQQQQQFQGLSPIYKVQKKPGVLKKRIKILKQVDAQAQEQILRLSQMLQNSIVYKRKQFIERCKSLIQKLQQQQKKQQQIQKDQTEEKKQIKKENQKILNLILSKKMEKSKSLLTFAKKISPIQKETNNIKRLLFRQEQNQIPQTTRDNFQKKSKSKSKSVMKRNQQRFTTQFEYNNPQLSILCQGIYPKSPPHPISVHSPQFLAKKIKEVYNDEQMLKFYESLINRQDFDMQLHQKKKKRIILQPKDTYFKKMYKKLIKIKEDRIQRNDKIMQK